MAKPKITKIKASETSPKKEVKPVAKPETKPVKKERKTFILFRPFVAFFRYLRDSWKEIRQVRWPSRRATWKMVLAVLVYTALFVLIISLLDLFFTWLFNLILGN